jgi:hypothetical protein
MGDFETGCVTDSVMARYPFDGKHVEDRSLVLGWGFQPTKLGKLRNNALVDKLKLQVISGLSRRKQLADGLQPSPIVNGRTDMKTVQLAIGNMEYAQSLRDLLLRDGTHRVYVVDRPDLRLDGIVMIDGDRPGNLSMLDSEPERFVVIAHKGSDSLSRIWDAGVRHVLFDGDPANTAQLAIIAAELRLPMMRGPKTPRDGDGHHTRHLDIPAVDPPARCGRRRSPARFSNGV